MKYDIKMIEKLSMLVDGQLSEVDARKFLEQMRRDPNLYALCMKQEKIASFIRNHRRSHVPDKLSEKVLEAALKRLAEIRQEKTTERKNGDVTGKDIFPQMTHQVDPCPGKKEEKAHNELEALTIEHLKKLNRMRSHFIKLVMYELKTPLTAIRGALELFMSDIDQTKDSMKKKYLDIAIRNIDRIAALINDVLDMSRIEPGRMKLNIAASRQAKAVKTLHMLSELFEKTGNAENARKCYEKAKVLSAAGEEEIDIDTLLEYSLLLDKIRNREAAGSPITTIDNPDAKEHSSENAAENDSNV